MAGAAEKVRLVTGNDYAPFTDEKLPGGGWATAVVRAAFKAAGYETDFSWKPWKRGYIESQNGQFIGTFPYIPTAERQVDFLYSDAFFTETYVALSNTSESGNFLYYEDMKGKTICRPIGYAIADKFEQFKKAGEIQLFQPSDMTACMKTIGTLKEYVVILNRLQSVEQLKKVGSMRDQIKVHALKEKGFTLHFIVSKNIADGPLWIKRFNKGLKLIKKSGLYDQLNREFGFKS